MDAVNVYRHSFRESPVLSAPYVIVTANVLVAPSDAEAEWESGPGRLMVYEIRTGRFAPLRAPEAAVGHPNMAAARAVRSQRVLGSPATVVRQLHDLVAASAADEIMVCTIAYRLATRRRSLQLLAQAWSDGGR